MGGLARSITLRSGATISTHLAIFTLHQTTMSPPPPAHTHTPRQIKRIHEYKRQLMNVLSIIWRWKQLKAMTPAERKKVVPRVCVIGGKAASGE